MRALADGPDADAAAQAALAAWLAQTRRVPLALPYARRAAASNPSEASVLIDLSIAFDKSIVYTEALAYAERAVAAAPADPRALAQHAVALDNDLQFDAAFERAAKAYSLAPDDPFVLRALGDVLAGRADPWRALSAYQLAVRRAPKDVLGLVVLARAQARLDEMDAAFETLHQAEALAPTLINPLEAEAFLKMQLSALGEASEIITRVQRLDTIGYSTALLQGRLARMQDDNDRAIGYYMEAERKGAPGMGAAMAIGEIYVANHECDTAARQFERLLAQNPRSADVQASIGSARVCARDYAKAADSLRRAISLNPYGTAAYFDLTAVLAAQDRLDDARDAAARYLVLSSGGAYGHALASLLTDVQSSLTELLIARRSAGAGTAFDVEIAEVAFGQGIYAEAEQFARAAVKSNPTIRQSRLLLAGALVMQGKRETVREAIEILKPHVVRYPDDADARFYLGAAYYFQESWGESRVQMEAYQSLAAADKQRPDAKRYPVSRLVEELRDAYYVFDGSAVAQLTRSYGFNAAGKVSFDVGPALIDGHYARVLTATLTLSPTVTTDARQLDAAGLLLPRLVSYLPRIRPEATGGLVLVARRASGPTLTLRYDLERAKRFALGGVRLQALRDGLEVAWSVDPRKVSISEIQANATALRELPAVKGIKVVGLSPAQMVTRVLSETRPGDASAVAHERAMLELMDVITPATRLDGLDRAGAEDVAGVYFPDEKAFYVVQSPTRDAYFDIVVAHEHVHALQDAAYDLTKIQHNCPNQDACRAIKALIEGDATALMYEYADKLVPVIEYAVAESRAALAEKRTIGSRAFPDYFYGMGTFPYREGTWFVDRLKKGGGVDAVSRAFARPPASTEQVLHYEKYTANERPLDVTLPAFDGVGGGWKEIERDVAGELGLRMFLAGSIGPVAASVAADGWGGDRYALLENGKGQYALVMRTRWDTEKDADMFADLMWVATGRRAGFRETTALDVARPTVRRFESADLQISITRGSDGKTVDVIFAGGDAATLTAFEKAMQ